MTTKLIKKIIKLKILNNMLIINQYYLINIILINDINKYCNNYRYETWNFLIKKFFFNKYFQLIKIQY